MIIYSKEINKDINLYLKDNNYTKIFILVDDNTSKYCLTLLSLNFKYQVIKIKYGEKNKNINSVSYIWENLLLNNADRSSLLINLGGGVISDMGAFAASTYKRGIDFINIPTTLLAMVDATIGGKTGFNFQNKKNMIGLFSSPKMIFIDTKFLLTLDKREFLNGIAEVLKHGLLFDMKYFDDIIASVEMHGRASLSENWEAIVKKSILFKKSIVDEDYDEKGIRKVLNLGHTIGHALESYFLDLCIDLKHGEAVVLGLIAMLYLSNKKYNFDSELQKRITDDFKKVYSLNIYSKFDTDKVINYLLNDKKNKDGNILMVLLKDVNKAIYDILVSIEEIEESLDYIAVVFN